MAPGQGHFGEGFGLWWLRLQKAWRLYKGFLARGLGFSGCMWALWQRIGASVAVSAKVLAPMRGPLAKGWVLE